MHAAKCETNTHTHMHTYIYIFVNVYIYYANAADRKCLHIVQTYTYLFAQNPRQTCKDDERHTRAAAIKHSVHRVLSSAQTNTHTHTDYTLQTYMQVGTGRKTTLANDVHQIASKVSARVLTTHLSSRTSLFPLSIFNYIFIFVVAE